MPVTIQQLEKQLEDKKREIEALQSVLNEKGINIDMGNSLIIDKDLRELIRGIVQRNAEKYVRNYLDSALIGFIEDEIKEVVRSVVGDSLRSIIHDYLKEKGQKVIKSLEPK